MLTRHELVRILEDHLDCDVLKEFQKPGGFGSSLWGRVLNSIWYPLRKVPGDYGDYLIEEKRWSKNVD